MRRTSSEFANGAWRANNPIPASMTRWSRRWAAGETAKDKLQDILEARLRTRTPQRQHRADHRRLLRRLHGRIPGQCPRHRTDQALVRQDRHGAQDIAALQQVMAEMHDIQVRFPSRWAASRTRTSHAGAGRSSARRARPARSRLLPETRDRFKEAAKSMSEHVANMFKLAGWDQKSAAAGCADDHEMETKFAEASLDKVALRDPSATDHNTTFVQLQAMAPHFDWAGYFQTQADFPRTST